MPTFDFRRRPAGTVFISGDGEDLVIGSRFADAFSVGGGDDTLFGRAGDDTLSGGTGRDLLTGNGGSDTFVVRPGDLAASPADRIDTIVGFQGAGTSTHRAQDVLRLEGFSAAATVRFVGLADPDTPTLQLYEIVDEGTLGGGGFILISVAGRITRQLTDADVVFAPRDPAPSDILLSNATIVENDIPGATVGVFSAVDADPGDTATFLLLDDAGGRFAIGGDGRTLFANDTLDFETAPAAGYAILVLATDSTGLSVERTLTVRVTDADEDVVARDDAYAAIEDTALAVATAGGVLANDAAGDGGLLAVAATIATARGGTVVLATDGSFTYTPAINADGEDSFAYTVRDTDGDEATAIARIAVAAVDDGPPIARDDAYAVGEDTPITVAAADGLLANDETGDGGLALTIGGSFATQAGGRITLPLFTPDGSFTYTPPANFSGEDRFFYNLRDADGDIGGATVVFTVAPTDDPVDAGDDAYAVDEDRVLSVPAAAGVLANDQAPDGIRFNGFEGSTARGGRVVLAADGSFTYTPAANFNGEDIFLYFLGDTDGDADAATVRIAVRQVNDEPSFSTDAYAFGIAENNAVGALVGTTQATNVDGGDRLVYAIRENRPGDPGTDVPFTIDAEGRITATARFNFERAREYNFTVIVRDTCDDFDAAPVTVTVGDVSDTLDLVTANNGGNDVGARLNDGAGNFSVPAAGGGTAVGQFPQTVALGDLNRDGKLDFVTASITDGTVSVRLGDGAGGFAAPGGTRPAEVPVGAGPRSAALGDIDGDGRLDVLVANGDNDNVTVLIGDGGGGVAAPGGGRAAQIAVGDRPQSLALADVSGDGDLDFVVTNFFDDSVSVRLGDGAGGFAAAGDVGVGDGVFWVAMGDLNGDGRIDFVTADALADSVSVRLGDGAGGFAAPAGGRPAEIAVGRAPTSVALGDLNGDGRLDLVTANTNNNNVSIRLGDGAGGFGLPTGGRPGEVAVDQNPTQVALGDIDGDGRLDILTANFIGTNVSVRLGDGAGGVFGPVGGFAGEVGTGLRPISLALGDLDGVGGLTPSGLPDLGPLLPLPAELSPFG